MTDPDRLADTYTQAEWARGRAGQLVADFHRFWYDTDRYASVTWFGHECWKYPTDMLIYAELVHELRPTTIVETGTYRGGSTLYWAHLLDIIGAPGDGRVVSVDIHDDDDIGPDPRGHLRPTHPRIVYVKGSSVDPDVRRQVADLIAPGPTLVILDSDHTAPHVLAELAVYAPVADLLIVEDTNLGHEVLPAWGPGPAEAVTEWLAGPDGDRWAPDRNLERLLLTCAPGGFLRRR